MNVTEALKLRRTTRGFLGAEVPKETLLEIVELARLAPSNSNTQPWHIAVASGETRQIPEAAVLEEVTNGMKPHPQWPPVAWVCKATTNNVSTTVQIATTDQWALPALTPRLDRSC